jgi:pyruvate dehydrogenase complex dehydrogenase (E1) component
MRNHAEQVRKYIPSRYEVLGTDGFGRSDSRAALRDSKHLRGFFNFSKNGART